MKNGGSPSCTFFREPFQITKEAKIHPAAAAGWGVPSGFWCGADDWVGGRDDPGEIGWLEKTGRQIFRQLQGYNNILYSRQF